MASASTMIETGVPEMASPSLLTTTTDEAIDAVIDDGFVADDRNDVTRFLRENPDLVPVLARIKARLGPPLAADMPLRLHLAYDPEWEDDPPRLWVLIPTTLDVQPAREAIDVVGRDWWLPEFRRFGDRLIIGLDYV
jgi:hypothetical protein